MDPVKAGAAVAVISILSLLYIVLLFIPLLLALLPPGNPRCSRARESMLKTGREGSDELETDTLGILVKLSIADGELDIGKGIEAKCCTARRRRIVGEVMRAKRGFGEEQKLMRMS